MSITLNLLKKRITPPDSYTTEHCDRTEPNNRKGGSAQSLLPFLHSFHLKRMRYRRRESSVEEAFIEMYLAGIPVRRVESITEALWGSKQYINLKF